MDELVALLFAAAVVKKVLGPKLAMMPERKGPLTPWPDGGSRG